MHYLTRLLLIIFLVLPTIGFAQQLELRRDSTTRNWSFSVTGNAFFASQSTDLLGEGVSQPYTDISSVMNSGFQLTAAARYKNWLLSVEGTNTNLDSELQALVAVKLSIDQHMIHTKLGYLLVESINFSEDGEMMNGWTFQGTISARYWRNDIFLDLDDTPEIDFEGIQEWTDVMIGVESTFVLGRKVIIGVSGDVGGFGLFDGGSDFSSAFCFTTSYRATQNLWLNVDFRSFEYDRTDGEEASEINTNVSVVGPSLGATFVF